MPNRRLPFFYHYVVCFAEISNCKVIFVIISLTKTTFMKHIVSIALLMTIFTSAQAQFLLGGQFSINTSSSKFKFGDTETEGAKFTSITILPRLAYTGDDFWFGIDAGITNIKSESPNFPSGTDVEKSTVFSVAPFARYIKKPVDNLGIWVEGQAGVSFGASEDNGRDDEGYFNITAGIRPGIILFIGNHLSFEASFGSLAFSSTKITDKANPDPESTETYNAFGLNVNQNLDLGDAFFTPAFLGNFNFGVNWMF